MPMIFSKDLVFLHVPKTGGVSVSQYLFKALPKPVYYVRPTALQAPTYVHVPGNNHQTLAGAQEILAQHGFDLMALPLILTVIRNPYDLAVSRYSYFRRPDTPAGKSSRVLELARESDFAGFVRTSIATPSINFMRTFHKFYYLKRKRPPNLTIARFENLERDIKAALAGIGISSDAEFPWHNKSERRAFPEYYDEETEELIYHAAKWVFDEGFYDRLNLPALSQSA